MTASMLLGGKGKVRLRSTTAALRPSTMPQSSKKRRPSASTRCIEPVTNCAAPWKVSRGSVEIAVIGLLYAKKHAVVVLTRDGQVVQVSRLAGVALDDD